jgi:glycosyltransferase involved in cell wall biosynthesis
VKWEVSLVYGRDAKVCRAAFQESFINHDVLQNPKPVKKPARLLSVCRLVDKKRVDLIINAFSQTSTDARLRVVGTGPEQTRLQELAAVSKHGDRIRFLGAVDDHELERQLTEADCFISMDIGDFDISVVEAMGRGLRVIVAKDFDVESFGPDLSGVLSVNPDVHSLAAAMDNVYNMAGPSPENLAILLQLTWQALARTVAEG